MNKFVITCPVCHSMCRPARVCSQATASAVRAANGGAGGGANFRRDGYLPDGEGCRRVEGHPAEGERAGSIGRCGHEAPCGGSLLRHPDAHEHRRGDCSAGGCAGGGGESRRREKDTYAAGTKKSIRQSK